MVLKNMILMQKKKKKRRKKVFVFLSAGGNIANLVLPLLAFQFSGVYL